MFRFHLPITLRWEGGDWQTDRDILMNDGVVDGVSGQIVCHHTDGYILRSVFESRWSPHDRWNHGWNQFDRLQSINLVTIQFLFARWDWRNRSIQRPARSVHHLDHDHPSDELIVSLWHPVRLALCCQWTTGRSVADCMVHKRRCTEKRRSTKDNNVTHRSGNLEPDLQTLSAQYWWCSANPFQSSEIYQYHWRSAQ